MNLKNPSNIGAYLFRWISSIDLVMLVALALLIALGSILLFSASGENLKMMNKHTIHLILATIGMLAATQLSSDLLRRWSFWIYVIGCLLYTSPSPRDRG